MLRLDALPVRAICADERLVFVAEAPLRGQHAGHSGTQHGGRLTAREARTAKVSRTLNGGGYAISCLLATSDTHLWSGSYDGVVRVARRGGQALHEARAHASSVHALAEACSSAVVFSAGADFLVRAWSLSLMPLRTMRAHTCPVHCLAAPSVTDAAVAPEAGGLADEELWSGGDDHAIHVWKAGEATGFSHVVCLDREFGAPVRLLVVQSIAAPRVWAADTAGALRVYHARSHAVLRTLVTAGSAPPATSIAPTASGAVWVGDASGCLTVYEGHSTAPLARLDGAHLGAVGGLASPAGSGGGGGGGVGEGRMGSITLVWSFGADATVRVWGMSEQLPEKVSSPGLSSDCAPK